eukprot:Seg4607.9 transcript_id=Seg4607.9/GoldUCD/mRNA.D3Y31 product="hypothetical protein" protein_id=Seg4607.9/GoldUCD/D3Y31
MRNGVFSPSCGDPEFNSLIADLLFMSENSSLSRQTALPAVRSSPYHATGHHKYQRVASDCGRSVTACLASVKHCYAMGRRALPSLIQFDLYFQRPNTTPHGQILQLPRKSTRSTLRLRYHGSPVLLKSCVHKQDDQWKNELDHANPSRLPYSR